MPISPSRPETLLRRLVRAALIGFLTLALVAPAFAAPAASGGLTVPPLPPLTAGSLPAQGGSSAALGGTMLFPLASQDLSYQLLQMVFGHEVTDIANGQWTGSPSATKPGQTTQTGTGSIMAAGFGIYNMAILIVVALMTVWGTLTGILHTANEGEWLGKNGSAFWVPVRIVLAGAMLLPVLGGYSVIQGVVIWGSLEGAAVADAASNVMIQEFVARPQVTAPMPPQGRQIAAALLASQSCANYYNWHTGPELTNYNPQAASPTQWYVDTLVTQTVPPDTTYTLEDPRGAPIWVHTVASTGNAEAVSYTFLHPPSATWWPGPTGRIPAVSNICGNISLKVPLNLPSQGLAGGLLSEVNNASALEAARVTMMNADISGFLAARADVLPLARMLATGRAPVSSTTGEIVPPRPVYMAPATIPVPTGPGGVTPSSTPPPPPSAPTRADVAQGEATFANAGPAFDGPVAQGSATVLRQLIGQHNLSAITREVQANGWLTLGSLWLTIARIDQSDHNLATPHLSTTLPSATTMIAEESRGHTVIHQAIAVGASPTLNLGNPISSSAQSRRSEPFYDRWTHDAISGVSDFISRALMLPVEGILWGLTGSQGGGWGSAEGTLRGTVAALTHGNPLIAFMNAGQLLLTMAGALLVLWIGLKMVGMFKGVATAGASAVTGGVGGAFFGTLLQYLAKIASLALSLVLVFLIAGFVLGILLPALPMIAFLSGVLGWLLAVAETLVAAPLWAAAHVSFEGNGWAPQRAQMGYQMIGGLVLRPILLVLGLFLAIALMEGAAWLVGAFFLGYASNYLSGTQSITQALEADGLLIVLIGLLIYLSHMAVRIISSLPDQVLKWIGGGNDALGGAGDMEGKVREVFGGVVNYGRAGHTNASKILGADTKPENREGGSDAKAAAAENREEDTGSINNDSLPRV